MQCLRISLLTTGALLTSIRLFGGNPANVLSRECVRMNTLLSEQIAGGRLDDAKRSVDETLSQVPIEPVCAGLLSNNLAAALQIAGRLDEARVFAERAIAQFQKSLAADDSAYLRPLQIIATVDLLQGMTGKAREVFRRMQAIRATDPSDRVLLLWISGSLLEREGRKQEAESALIAARAALSDAGRQNSADAASICGQLACLYLHERRYREAAAAVNTALSTLSLAGDVRPLDRIKLLDTRAAVCAHENRWPDAESDLAEAVSLAREQPKIDSVELRPLVKDYAYVLRKLHRKEARSIEAWASALQSTNTASGQVVDLTELAAGRNE